MKNISQETINKNLIPKDVLWVCEMLSKNNFDSYLVGGCVRDLFLFREPKDWDITTNATPDEIINIFGTDETVYENPFGTVGVKIRKDEGETEVVEVTTYRKEGEYKDFRRPERLEWGKNIEEDLERRDFTMNAIAYDPIKDTIKDIYKGQNDIKDKIIRTVGEAEERFNEDALRMLRAVRFSAQLNFVISNETLEAIFRLASNLEKISKERIRDEFIKIIMSSNPMQGLLISQKLGMLKYISTELESAVGIEQNGHHAFDVFEHSLRSLNHAASREFDLEIRLAALFHDIGKVKTRRFDETKKDYTFYGHEVVSERVTKKILEELKFEKKVVEKVCRLVRWHMFFSDPDEVTLSSVRRLIVNIGKENIWDLIDLRLCDRMGSGTKKEEPWRLRKFESMIEEALRDPISLKTLKIDGAKIMQILNEKPGKKIGLILHALFEEVIDNASKNNLKYLENRVFELNKLSEEELEKLATAGKYKMQEKNAEELEEIKKKFKV
ncbi:MAG TPA: CCA tRNA nucleotidyltransferase [Candidatus Paceibacterota bacterium]|nr:CCA tRNA nucleotidyltransferase [Candidatus Paceibacterota bacterium]HQB56867.1 CCA tRNA nucleotidyltransferase [Candidatus Paceibacterota bacterium]